MSEHRGSLNGISGYLSIREVLDELVAEFDDVTISKIRFLESRGLIHPERTPSGYRKFFPADVERLRWILRQQRENFLPLKVIKRRLDLEDGKSLELPDSPSLFDDEMDLVDRDRELANVVSNIRQSARPTHYETQDRPEHLDHQAVVNDSISSLIDNTDTSPVVKPHLAAVPKASALLNGVGRDAHEPSHDLASKHPNHPSQVEVGDGSDHAPGSTEKPASSHASESTKEAAVETSSVRSNQTARQEVSDALSDVSFSIDELAAATSTTVEVVAELEEFGFISSRLVAGVPCFDGDAVIIAKAIIGLRAYGLEARHLKSIRHAAERDAALYGQVVAPLLRQRNPEARVRAKKQLEELADKGSALYEQILRAELRRVGGG